MQIAAIDCETTGLSTYHGDLPFSIALAIRDEKTENINTIYVEFPVNPKTREVTYNWQDQGFNGEALLEYLASPFIAKVGHNIKFDLKMLNAANIIVNGDFHDTSIAARICNTLEPTYKLKPLAKKYLGISDQDEKDLKREVIKCHNLAKKMGIPTRKVEEDYFLPGLFLKSDKNKRYNIQDVIRTIRLCEFYIDGMEQLGLREFYDVEMELMPILLKMEDKGVRFNYNRCLEEIDGHRKILGRVTENLRRDLGDINFNSPKQLLPALRKYIPDLKNTQADELDFYPELEVVENIQEYRGRAKGTQTLSGYLESCVPERNKTANDLLVWQNCKTIYTTFNQGNVRTWRLSSSEENLQNVPNPKTSEALVDGRCVFEPRLGYVWYCFDFSGQEARIFASTHKVKSILDLYAAGIDPFDEYRKRIPELAKFKEVKIGRKYTKNVFYSKIYGGGPKALMKYIHKPKNYCELLIQQFDKELPEVNDAIKSSYKFGLENGYVKNAYGRKIDIDPERAYTTSCNGIVQCSAAELMKRSMIKAHKYLKTTGLDIYLLLSIHDELVIEARKEHARKDVLIKVKELMQDNEGYFCLDTPVEVEKTTTNWSNKTKIGMEWINGEQEKLKEKIKFYI